jgi:hypothetical protein
MVMGAVSSRWQTRTELRRVMGAARPVMRADVYASEALRIVRVATLTAGSYFVVTESDILFPEDFSALERLDTELMANWRNRVVESDSFGHPHKWFPFSNTFQVHLVHPAFRSEWEYID